MRPKSKRYNSIRKDIDTSKTYSLNEAVTLIKKFPKVKFDETVELHFNFNIDTKKTDQLIRGTTILPHGTGKKIKLLVICKGEKQNIAREKGAEYVGDQELINKIAGGWLDFDKIIATPEMMKDLSRLGKVLGPRGLMPSPKTGTVTDNIEQAIEDAKAGKIEYKMDKQGGVHLGIGKVSFNDDMIIDNAKVVIESIIASKPSSVKGKFIKSIALSTSMGYGLRLAS